MPVRYEYDKEKRVINTDAYGDVKTEEIVQYLDLILSDEEIVYGSVEVFSLENVTDLDMKYSEVAVFSVKWAEYKKRIGKKILVIAPSKFSYGLFRMLLTAVTIEDEEAADAFVLLRSRDELSDYLS